MTRYDALLRCLRSGDPGSALAVWRSRQWTDTDRQRAVRLLTAAQTVAIEVLP